MSHDEKDSGSNGQCNDSVGSNGSSNGSFEIGKVMEKVQDCKYGNSNKVGTLLIASEAISWQSSNNFFGMFGDPRLILPFKSIQDITTNSSSIIIKLENDKEHIFSGFSKTDMDKKLKLLHQILSNHEHTTSTTNTSTSTNSTMTHSSNGSHLEEDPKCSKNGDDEERKQNKLALFNAIQEEIDGTGEGYEEEEGGGHDVVDSAVKEALMISKSMKVCMENMKNEKNENNNDNNNSSGDNIPILSGGKIGETEEDYLAIATIAAMAEFRSVSRYISDKKKALRKLEDDLTMEDEKTKIKKAPTEMKTAWSECRESMIHSFKESVVENFAIGCDLDTFFEKFLSDSTPTNLGAHQEMTGDSEVSISPWKQTDDGLFSQKKRTINYVHPINAPMAPPQAEASKYQTLQIYGKYGLCLRSKVEVNDVPMTDCFYVEELILVEANTPKSLLLTMKFDIRFVKSTIFRRIIEGTTKSEITHGMSDLANYFSSIIENGTVDSSDRRQRLSSSHSMESSSSPTNLSTKFILLCFIMIMAFQSFTFLQLQSYKQFILQLEDRIRILESNNHNHNNNNNNNSCNTTDYDTVILPIDSKIKYDPTPNNDFENRLNDIESIGTVLLEKLLELKEAKSNTFN